MRTCSADKKGHKTVEGALRCPVHRFAAVVPVRPRSWPAPALGVTSRSNLSPIGLSLQEARTEAIQRMERSAREGFAHEVGWYDGVFYKTGDTVSHVHGNVGLVITREVPLRMLVGPDKIGFRSCLFSDDYTANLGRQQFHDCVVDGSADLRPSASAHMRSVVVSGDLTTAYSSTLNNVRVGGCLYVPRSSESHKHAQALRDVIVYGRADIDGGVVAVDGDSHCASGWYINDPGTHMVLRAPGQVVVVGYGDPDEYSIAVPDDGTIAVLSADEEQLMFYDERHADVAPGLVRAFSALIGRPRDGSEGACLHANNRGAWMELRASGGVSSDGSVDEELLELAILVMPNPL